jgi:hypothetical protein
MPPGCKRGSLEPRGPHRRASGENSTGRQGEEAYRSERVRPAGRAPSRGHRQTVRPLHAEPRPVRGLPAARGTYRPLPATAPAGGEADPVRLPPDDGPGPARGLHPPAAHRRVPERGLLGFAALQRGLAGASGARWADLSPAHRQPPCGCLRPGLLRPAPAPGRLVGHQDAPRLPRRQPRAPAGARGSPVRAQAQAAGLLRPGQGRVGLLRPRARPGEDHQPGQLAPQVRREAARLRRRPARVALLLPRVRRTGQGRARGAGSTRCCPSTTRRTSWGCPRA